MKIINSDDVVIGKNSRIDDDVIIGYLPANNNQGECKTVIGDNCTIRSGSVIYAGNNIGDNFQTGHNVIIRECNTIESDVSIGTASCIEHHIKIGKGSRIHSQAFIPEFSILEEGCWIGPNVVLTNSKYPNNEKSKNKLSGPTICKNSKIGANSTILPGIVVGRDSIVGAGSVVTKSIKEGSVNVGNPARKIRDTKEIEDYNE